jgi:SAM-dependent methyltransferase
VTNDREDLAARGTAGGAFAPRPTIPAAVIWHDLECGWYEADLPLWRELAEQAAARDGRVRASVLDVGAGTGRVALDLLARGHDVTAVELDAELVTALRARAAGEPPGGPAAGGRLTAVCADARRLADPQAGAPLGEATFALCTVAMQTIQILGGRSGREAFLRGVHRHLSPGGIVACAIADELDEFDRSAGDPVPPAERGRNGGLEYISQPVRVAVGPTEIVIEREREIRDARGAVEREHDAVRLDRLEPATLAAEAERAGLRALELRTVPETAEHLGSTVVIVGV